jgi:hypothetical protein
VLADPRHQVLPFEFFHCAQAFGADTCAEFDRLFAENEHWQRRDGDFYQCALRDATCEIPDPLLRDVVSRMREITKQPLMDTVQVTAQQVEPGQSIGVHSDRPLLGYECVRLVLQLNADWHPSDGGVLELYESPERPAVVRLNPVYDAAFGFVLHQDTYHGVTEVSRLRRSLVFNFWHVANSPALRDAVRNLFVDPQFSELPSALNPSAEWAESRLPEEATFNAGLAALALHRLGYDEETVVAAYRHSAGLALERALSTEEQAAARLADWIARLYQHPFDITQWERLRGDLRGMNPVARLATIWQLCIPNIC